MFNNTKIRIKSAAHSKLVQEALFKAGFRWGGGGAKVSNTSKPFLFIYEDLKYEGILSTSSHYRILNILELHFNKK